MKIHYGHAAADRIEQRDDDYSHCDGDDGDPTTTIDLGAGFGSGVDVSGGNDNAKRRLDKKNCNGVNTDYGNLRMWIGDGNTTGNFQYATPSSSGANWESAGTIQEGLPFAGRNWGSYQRDKIFGSR